MAQNHGKSDVRARRADSLDSAYNDFEVWSIIYFCNFISSEIKNYEKKFHVTAYEKTSKTTPRGLDDFRLKKCYFEYEFIALSGNPNIGTVINYVSIVTDIYES